jgi:hypothetical protein
VSFGVEVRQLCVTPFLYQFNSVIIDNFGGLLQQIVALLKRATISQSRFQLSSIFTELK